MPDQNLVAAIGGTATVLAVVSLLPQVVRTLRTRSANDLSLTWLVIAMVSMILWIAYGILLSAWSIAIANGATFVLVVILIALKIRFGLPAMEGADHG